MSNPPYMGISNSVVGLPAEEAIVKTVIYDLLPTLGNMLMILQRLQGIWNTPQNQIPAKIVTAATANVALAKYSPDDFARWGQGFAAFETYISAPITITLPDGSTEETTLRSILLTNYIPLEA